MLVQLQIRDLAIIDEVVVDLGPGLNVLTGETGAGKSIIVGAAGLLRGGRSSSDLIRSGSSVGVVEAVFDLSRSPPEIRQQLEEAGLPADPDELLVRRVLSRSGRGRVHLNGALCTVSVLGRITGRLLEIAGQHEHQMLSDRSTHRAILDSLGLDPELASGLHRAYEALKRADERLAQSQMDEQQRAERIGFLRYQLEELERASIDPGEDQELERERARLARGTDLLEATAGGERELYSCDGSVVERLAAYKHRLEEVVAVDPELEPLLRQLEEAQVLVEDAAVSLGRYAAGVEVDPARLQQVEERQDLIFRLLRKHGGTLSELVERQRAMQEELEELEHLDQTVERLEGQLADLRSQAEQAASGVSAARKRAARRLAKAVTGELESLRMKGAELSVEVTPLTTREGDQPALCFGERRLGPHGWDQVEFLIITNPGEESRPLQRVASGGELSRVMLALRKGLGDHDPVGTAIYDEVDAGIDGAVADVVGRSLAEVARHRQVLCVTHLPQVAAHADHHLLVGKSRTGRRVTTTVARLDDKARVEELARMLGGERVTSQARANARQLLKSARSQHI
jgi:DNA repair protein RecN (Recombination protein N)